ncbi:MAG: LacI family DNA-binding transcriptional regulator [Henriciella sp.]|jgi:LacI family transcriptional regulator
MNQRNKSGKVTIVDVAKKAGVSTMTISRVVNRDPKVKPSTRKKVENAIVELNYAPNVAARALKGSTVRRICLLYGNPSSAYLGELLLGALEAASEAGVHLVVERTDTAINLESLEKHFESDWDAIIIPPPMSDLAGIRQLVAKHNFPAVFLSSATKPGRANEIRIDDHLAAFEMTNALISEGHTRIGFIKGNPNQSVSERRLQGYFFALTEAGLPIDDNLIRDGLFTYRSGGQATSQLMALPSRPTAVFASNDDMAAGALASAARHGIAVPTELTIAGFDDSPIATTIWPALSTVRQPVAKMAKTAVEIVLHADAGKPPFKTIVMPHEIIRRGTTLETESTDLSVDRPT